MQTPPRDPLAVLATILALGLLSWIALRLGDLQAAPTTDPDLSRIESSLDRLVQTLESSKQVAGLQTGSIGQGPETIPEETAPRRTLPDTATLRRQIDELRSELLAWKRQGGQIRPDTLFPPPAQRTQRLRQINQALRDPDRSRRSLIQQQYLLQSEQQILSQLGKPHTVRVSQVGYETWSYGFKNAQGQDKGLRVRVANGRVVGVY